MPAIPPNGKAMESQYFANVLHFVVHDERYNKELIPAKQEFQQLAGPIYDTDRDFEPRMNAFHHWYILDRPMRESGLTPLQYFLQYNANSFAPDELRGYQDLLGNLHSLFELLRFTASYTWVRDVMTGNKYAVEGRDQTQHLDRGSLFNARLFTHGKDVFLSNYLIMHPMEVNGRIRREARKVRKKQDATKDFLFRLLLYQSRWEQYKQMDVAKIYRFED